CMRYLCDNAAPYCSWFSALLPLLITSFSFLFYSYGHHRDLHSFPTRRSSDLVDRQSLADQEREGFPFDGDFSSGGNPSEGLFFQDRKSTRLNSSHVKISYAVFCLKKKKTSK